jgi:hypothetical protein
MRSDSELVMCAATYAARRMWGTGVCLGDAALCSGSVLCTWVSASALLDSAHAPGDVLVWTLCLGHVKQVWSHDKAISGCPIPCWAVMVEQGCSSRQVDQVGV